MFMQKKKIAKFFIEAIVLTAICIIVSYLLIKDSFVDVMKLINNLNIWNIIVLVFVVFFLIISNGHILKIVASKFSNQFSTKDGAQTSVVGSLFSGITPFRVGYQFGVLYMYNKKGIKLKEGVAISYIEGTAYQFMISFLCLILSIYIGFNPVKVTIGDTLVNINLIIYLVTGINLIFSLGLTLIVKFRKLHEYLIRICLKFSKIFLKKKDISVIETKLRSSLTTIVENSSMLFENKLVCSSFYI